MLNKNKDKRPMDKNGQPHGYWEIYHNNGNLSFKGNYVHNQENGYWEWRYYNGNLWSEENWVYGNKRGYYSEYYDNGKLKCKTYYAK